MTSKRRPNKKQRRWVEEFCSRHPGSRVVSTKDATCGYFYYVISWNEDLPIFAPPNEEDEELDFGMGWVNRQLYVELTPAGIERLRREITAGIVYPHCLLDWRYYSTAPVQTILPIAEVLNLPVTEKPKRATSKRKKSQLSVTQHQLPVDPLGQEILQISMRHGGEVRSRQDLLSQKVPHYSLEMRTVIQMNQALIDLLKEVGATSHEWESAEMLLGVIGETGVLEYVRQIPSWRKFYNTRIAATVPTIPKFQSIQVQSV
jgi:hypothetical protein